MSTQPLVSVCMPAHRDSDFFRAALESVLGQTMGDLEVIVGDDSGGALRAAVEAAGDDRIRYVPHPKQLGFTGNHETTIDLARGKYIAVLHDDDVHHPDYLERMTAVLEADPELGLVCSDVWEIFPGGERQRPGLKVKGGRYDDWLPLVFSHNFFIPTSTVLRRETWEQRRTKHWPDHPIGDIVLWYDAAIDGTPMYWIAEPLADYRRHDAQISGLLATRTGQIEINRAYGFPERPEVDALRRKRVAAGLVGRAGARLRSGDAAGARTDLAEAKHEAPEVLTRKRQALEAIARVPGAGWAIARRSRGGDR
ncbi:MAG: glycosyltransferase family 2 protein [Solirubrobacteraceae bacterium]|nr:glycosyltransferase family 2 protein [Solirubrobacteraceae bacterium]